MRLVEVSSVTKNLLRLIRLDILNKFSTYNIVSNLKNLVMYKYENKDEKFQSR